MSSKQKIKAGIDYGKECARCACKKCIEHYNTVCDTGTNEKRFGKPPEGIVIALGEPQKSSEWKPISQREAVFRYSAHGLEEAAVDTVPDETERGMYFREASAELYATEEDTTFITLRFGKRYVRCYGYTVVSENGEVLLDREKLIWVS